MSDPTARDTAGFTDHDGPPPTGTDEWVDEGPVRLPTEGTRRGGRSSTGSRPSPPKASRSETALVGPGVDDLSAQRRKRIETQLNEAAEDFAGERFDEARKILKRLVEQLPQVPEIVELYGLTLYRLARWQAAADQLERLRELTGDCEQNPVLADCYRALGDHEAVDRLWNELRESAVDGEVMVEGRLVAAGSLADQGDLHGALRLLQQGPVRPRRPRDHTLRLWYAIGDLYERLGDLQRAREQFRMIVQREPGFVDAEERLEALI